MSKFILDTNVLLYDSNSLYRLGEEIIIPIVVIEELDTFKKGSDQTARNARVVLRTLDSLRKKGNLSEGVIDGKIKIKIDLGGNEDFIPTTLRTEKIDNIILNTVLKYSKKYGKENVKFITKDTNLRIKADTLDIHAEDYEPLQLKVDDIYEGTKTLNVPHGTLSEILENEKVESPSPMFPNQYVQLLWDEEPSGGLLGKYDEKTNFIKLLPRDYKVWGIRPRNEEQIFALNALLDDDIKLVTLTGKAGTGKTLLAIASGLKKTIDDQCHNKILASRPIIPLGRDMGYLPGNISEKLDPWMQPIYDNLEHIISSEQNIRSRRGEKNYEELIHQGLISVEPLTYIRGRSIANQYLIVDEAQNLTPHEIKTIITRAGYNTKIVLTGDPDQIDNPYLDFSNNGLSVIIEHFKKYPIHAHVTLKKGERSELSELASKIEL